MNMNQEGLLSLLFEIGTEDLPARFIPEARQQLLENTQKMLNENHLVFSHITTYATPRRIALIAQGIPPMQEDRTKEVFGPSTKVAYDQAGKPTKAAIGFANSQKVKVEDLIIKNKDKGEYVVAVVEEKGLHVRELFPDILAAIVLSVHLPKAMRWGDRNLRFVRPIRWLLALLNNEMIKFEIDGIQSSNLTRGHRFLSPAAFQIKDIQGYKKLLQNNYVIVDTEERKKVIMEKTESLLKTFKERIVSDPDLLETVANLVEYPVPVIAAFPAEYLALPKELLITVMKGHQKYFAIEDMEGKITNHFVVISNTSEENGETVKVGAERVIKARFEDARFYFEEDRKRPLSGRIEELKKVTFQEKLGSIYAKTERIVSIAEFLAERLLPSEKNHLIRAAWLCKTDLITGVVREFPELQGLMGKYYALNDGEESGVAIAVEEHYLPTHSGGDIPLTDIGALLSLADKIDNITAFFSIGLTPTGSEDPFALRRQALGIIAIILEKGYGIPLRELVDKAMSNFSDIQDSEGIKTSILKFFEGRIETVLSDQGYAVDLIKSVLNLTARVQLEDIQSRLKALKSFQDKTEFNEFLIAIKRVYNIIPKKEPSPIKNELLKEDSEKELKEKIVFVKSAFSDLLRNKKYVDALTVLLSTTASINNFFDNLLVMDKQADIKENRLALLSELWSTASSIADFSKLQSA